MKDRRQSTPRARSPLENRHSECHFDRSRHSTCDYAALDWRYFVLRLIGSPHIGQGREWSTDAESVEVGGSWRGGGWVGGRGGGSRGSQHDAVLERHVLIGGAAGAGDVRHGPDPDERRAQLGDERNNGGLCDLRTERELHGDEGDGGHEAAGVPAERRHSERPDRPGEDQPERLPVLGDPRRAECRGQATATRCSPRPT